MGVIRRMHEWATHEKAKFYGYNYFNNSRNYVILLRENFILQGGI